MAVYVVGDIQGCFKPLKTLLKRAKFDPELDVLWCCGDLVNRGPKSLEVLRFLKSLGDSCVCVLGNHDLQLLAYAAGGKSYSGDTLDEVLTAKDADELIEWLRFRPMLHHDAQLGWCMVHAGLSPLWSLKKAKKRAIKIEKELRSNHWGDFCKQLQDKKFRAHDVEKKVKRKLFSAAVLTRTRFCTKDGLFDWFRKTSAVSSFVVKPWFAHGKAKWKKDCRIVYGHWAAKGLVTNQKHVLGLDSGCVWGGSLSMARLDVQKNIPIHTIKCDACQQINNE